MKISPVLLGLSLAANFCLGAMLVLRPAAPRDQPIAARAAKGASGSARMPGLLNAEQIRALKSGDPDLLKTAGIPDDVANVLAAGRAFAKIGALEKTHKKLQATDPRYWRTSFFDASNFPAEQRAAEKAAQEEFEAAMRRAFPGYEENDAPAERYAYLPPAAREKLARIEKDYAEIEAEINSRAEGGILLPSDRAHLKMALEEKQRDIAAALSPAELEDLKLHDVNSDTVQTIRSRYGDAIQSEADYRKIFALQKAYDDRYPFFSGRTVTTAQEADNTRLQADIIAVIGEENYAVFQRAHDDSYQGLVAITKRLELPANTPDLVYAMRDLYAQQSEALYRDPSLPAANRRAQLKALGDKARADLQTKLGPDGAEAYAGEESGWVKLLKNGYAFSTNPKDAPLHASVSVTAYPLR